MKQLVLDLIRPPAPSLENFIVGRNREASASLSALQLRVDGGQQTMTACVYLWGPPGSGKSHLLHASNATPFTFGGMSDALPAVGLFAFDDVETAPDDVQVALFNLINSLSDYPRRALLVTGTRAPHELPIRPELSSRLAFHASLQLQPLSDIEKSEALLAHARARGFALRGEVVTYLLRHTRREMGALIAMLDALDQYSLESGREITLPLLREMNQPQLL